MPDAVLKNLLHVQELFKNFPCVDCEENGICVTAEVLLTFSNAMVFQMDEVIDGRKKRIFFDDDMAEANAMRALLIASFFGALTSWVSGYVRQQPIFNLERAVGRFLVDLEDEGLDWAKVSAGIAEAKVMKRKEEQ